MQETLLERVKKLEEEGGAKFILAYDYTSKGAEKAVANLLSRRDARELVEEVLLDVIKVSDGVERKSGKSKYVIVALHPQHVETIYLQWKIGAFGRSVEKKALGVVGFVSARLKEMGIVPITTKDAGTMVLKVSDLVDNGFVALS